MAHAEGLRLGKLLPQLHHTQLFANPKDQAGPSLALFHSTWHWDGGP